MSQRSAPVQFGQLLNPLDTALSCVDRSIRAMDYPGFETQMLVWLAGQVDAEQLRVGHDRLAVRYPVITSRLVEPVNGRRPYWRFQPAEMPVLTEIALPGSDPREVIHCAEELFSTPHDPAACAPLRFYLLRRQGGGDVLLLQYNHPLMDNSAAGLLLREWEELSRPGEERELQTHLESPRLVRQRLRRASRGDRRAGITSAVKAQRDSTRGGVAVVGKGARHGSGVARLRLAMRVIDEEQTRAIQAATNRLGTLPSLSMTILASTFRAMHHFGSERDDGARNYVAGIGLDMHVGRRKEPQLQNLLTIVPIVARSEELSDARELIRMLNAQLRNRLVSKVDLGYMALTAIFQRRPQHLRMIVEHTLRRGYSLWYAYFGSLDFLGRQLWGSDIEKVCLVGPTWAPMGFSLLANQFQGQLFLQATYDPELVSEPLADELLDKIVAELREIAGQERQADAGR
jgi:hypothetical protein